MSTARTSASARTYRRRITPWWWLRNIRYTQFMLQEVSALFLAAFAVVYLVQAAMLAAGPGAYQNFIGAMTSPGWVAFHFLVLIFAIIHAITWLWLSARIFGTRIGKIQLPAPALLAGGLVVWIGVSVGIALVLLEG